MLRKFLFFIYMFSGFACNYQHPAHTQRLSLSEATLDLLKQNKDERLNFLQSKNNKESIRPIPCFGGPCLTKMVNSTIPQTSFLADYNFLVEEPLLISCFPQSFLPYVPKDILNKLKSYKIDPKDIKLCWIVQDGFVLGQNEETTGNSVRDKGFTRLKAHGFAAPDAPEYFSGDLVNRNFLHGIFEPDDIKISEADLKINELLSFPVHVHDGALSPPGMAKIAISSKSPSQSFWSLVIDDKHKPVRANITLHWVLGYEKRSKKTYYTDKVRSAVSHFFQDKWTNWRPIDKNTQIREYQDLIFKNIISDIKKHPDIKDHKILHSLKKLLSDVWLLF